MRCERPVADGHGLTGGWGLWCVLREGRPTALANGRTSERRMASTERGSETANGEETPTSGRRAFRRFANSPVPGPAPSPLGIFLAKTPGRRLWGTHLARCEVRRKRLHPPSPWQRPGTRPAGERTKYPAWALFASSQDGSTGQGLWLCSCARTQQMRWSVVQALFVCSQGRSRQQQGKERGWCNALLVVPCCRWRLSPAPARPSPSTRSARGMPAPRTRWTTTSSTEARRQLVPNPNEPITSEVLQEAVSRRRDRIKARRARERGRRRA
jgi:hypothetical protein